ncbi:TPA: hypothetical protein N0F65_004709 [Lagenidium giganteum]|uniref:Reverse transcriptase/retrotransposon-derived protein RNase H-like domain-containing protein n=1 Tax=Lagenidium giganteum TaxID=4803 RepID=A0AAV2Z401_9STRA|nr:TPA: hypothetical protein N0F65_004709 [Lagenidium giganteum]
MIDNALWVFVRRLQDAGESVRVIGAADEELQLLSRADESTELSPLDVPIKDDVFVLREAAALELTPIIYRRSFLDDISFCARDWKTLCTMLQELLESYQYRGVTISLRKSVFGKKKVEFLSHEIDRHGIKPKPKNLKGVLAMPFPKTLKGVQKFIGCLVYCHRFIDNFATFASALYELTDAQLASGENMDHARAAFEALKRKLAEAPILKHADRAKPFSIIVYVNRWAYGAAVTKRVFKSRFFASQGSRLPEGGASFCLLLLLTSHCVPRLRKEFGLHNPREGLVAEALAAIVAW